MNEARLVLLVAAGLAGLAATFWVFHSAQGGPEAARRHLGTHRLALGCMAAVYVGSVLFQAPFVGSIRPDQLNARSFLLVALSTQIPMFLIIWGRLVRPGALGWSDLGLRAAAIGTVLRVGFTTWLLGLGILILLGLAFRAFGAAHNQAALYGFLSGADRQTLATVLLVGAVLVPINEELFFRGFVFGTYRGRYGRGMAYLAGGLVFTLPHVSQVSLEIGSVVALLLPIFVLATLYSFAYERTGSLWASILAHGLNNATGFIAVYAAGTGPGPV